MLTYLLIGCGSQKHKSNDDVAEDTHICDCVSISGLFVLYYCAIHLRHDELRTRQKLVGFYWNATELLDLWYCLCWSWSHKTKSYSLLKDCGFGSRRNQLFSYLMFNLGIAYGAKVGLKLRLGAMWKIYRLMSRYLHLSFKLSQFEVHLWVFCILWCYSFYILQKILPCCCWLCGDNSELSTRDICLCLPVSAPCISTAMVPENTNLRQGKT